SGLEPALGSRLRRAFLHLSRSFDTVRQSIPNLLPVCSCGTLSIIQRKVLTPNDFASLAGLEDRLLRFQKHYETSATPFQWTFTRRHLATLLHHLDASNARRAA
ncbi:MAG: hypothetical protein M0002_06205, partial [Rhodospirillales bacterium]|nr:hypothetical protein [Rhodospirillales bacterium]